MSIATYADLKGQITAFTARTDLAAPADTFIDLAEARFKRDLRLREMESSAVITLTDGVGSLPADYLEWRTVRVNSAPKATLDYMTPSQLFGAYADYTGIAGHFTIAGDNITVRPTPSNTITLDYYASFPALADGQTTNNLLTRHPGIYLYGCLLEAASYTQDMQAAAGYNALYQAEVAAARQDDFGARYANIASRPSGPTP
jgi:hypothetical protein